MTLLYICERKVLLWKLLGLLQSLLLFSLPGVLCPKALYCQGLNMASGVRRILSREVFYNWMQAMMPRQLWERCWAGVGNSDTFFSSWKIEWTFQTQGRDILPCEYGQWQPSERGKNQSRGGGGGGCLNPPVYASEYGFVLRSTSLKYSIVRLTPSQVLILQSWKSNVYAYM